MNELNIMRLIEFFEAGAPDYDLRMGEWLILPPDAVIPTLCGSSGCIAGAAYAMAGDIHISNRNSYLATHEGAVRRFVCADGVEDVAADWMGLSIHDADRLFCGNMEATPKDVVAALRNILNGKAPWSDARIDDPAAT